VNYIIIFVKKQDFQKTSQDFMVLKFFLDSHTYIQWKFFIEI